MQSLEDLSVPYWLLSQFPPRRKSNSYDDSEASHIIRKLSLPTTHITYPSSPALNLEGDGPGTPRPRFRDGYFTSVFSSTPPTFALGASDTEPQSTPHSPYGVDPPRSARTGFEWVWFPEGYWAEREAPETPRKSPTAGFLSKLRGRSGKSISDPGLRRFERSSGCDPSQKTITPRINTPYSPYTSEEAHVASLQHPLGQRPKYLNELLSSSLQRESPTQSRISDDDLTPIVEATAGSSGEEDVKSGVLCIPKKRRMKKSRRGSGGLRTSRLVEDIPAAAEDVVGISQTTSNTKSAVRFKAEAKPKEYTHRSSLVKKWFGKAPWHRKGSGETASSVTSSVREVLAGKTPPGTPMTESTSGSAKRRFNSNYPGGEATRITTPPISEYPDKGTSRAFFSETKPPGDHDDSWTAANSSSSFVAQDRTGPHPPKDWVWRNPPDRGHSFPTTPEREL